jgi:hypothetical protein
MIDPKTTVIPEEMLQKMSAADRAQFGKGGMTTAECDEKQIKEAERVLQRETRSYLDLHGIQYICPPMNQRSKLPPGWPDFTFCYRGVAIAAEAKVFGKGPEPHQAAMHEKLRKDGWTIIVFCSVADIQRLMREIDTRRHGWICMREHSLYKTREEAIKFDPNGHQDPTHFREVLE